MDGRDLHTHLFAKIPRPGDSEGTFSVHLRVKRPPVDFFLT